MHEHCTLSLGHIISTHVTYDVCVLVELFSVYGKYLENNVHYNRQLPSIDISQPWVLCRFDNRLA